MAEPVAMMGTEGFRCFRCGTMLETPFSAPQFEEAAQYAGEHGWCIGHWDGQGEYVCGDCTAAVWDAIPLNAGGSRG